MIKQNFPKFNADIIHKIIYSIVGIIAIIEALNKLLR